MSPLPDGPFLIGSVLYNSPKKVADFVRSQMPRQSAVSWEYAADGEPLFSALGVVRGGNLVGGVVFHNYHPNAHDIEISAAMLNPRWCFPATVKQLFAYPLAQLKCTRITARTSRRNKPARTFLERLGFRVEGVMRRAHDGKQDVILYGLLVEQSEWLKRK